MIAQSNPRRGEEGMTLIELIISISLLGILVGPILSFIVVGFLSSDGSTNKVADSVSAQLVSTYLVTDIQSADVVRPLEGACGAAGTALLHLSWNIPGSTAINDVVYFSAVGPSGRTELRRETCGAGGSSSTLLMQDLADSGMTTTCQPTVTCGANQDTVRVQLRAENASPLSDAYYQPFAFEIRAHPRSSTT
jgi:prepilin-type N-terminal cleavage/methylation domain-containing protein